MRETRGLILDLVGVGSYVLWYQFQQVPQGHKKWAEVKCRAYYNVKIRSVVNFHNTMKHIDVSAINTGLQMLLLLYVHLFSNELTHLGMQQKLNTELSLMKCRFYFKEQRSHLKLHFKTTFLSVCYRKAQSHLSISSLHNLIPACNENSWIFLILK